MTQMQELLDKIKNSTLVLSFFTTVFLLLENFFTGAEITKLQKYVAESTMKQSRKGFTECKLNLTQDKSSQSM